MDEVKKYWRDSVMKLAGWGTGILVVVAGWAMFQSQLFELKPGAHDREQLRAVALLVFAYGGTVAWILALRWVYKNHLSEGTDATVVEWRFMRTYAIVVTVCTWMLASLAAFR